jgi:uncharacterized membrane protein
MQSPAAVVHAVLFYSPTCGHCHQVITEVLPPLLEQYGDQLYMVGVDVTQPGSDDLFRTVLQHFNLERGGVPFLVVGDTYLIGSLDIPDKFPGLIEEYLAQGGVGWPDIPGLSEALAPAQSDGGTSTPPSAESTPTSAALVMPDASDPAPGSVLNGGEGSASLWANFSRDLLGNSLAVLVLAGMFITLGRATLIIWRVPVVGVPDVHGRLSLSWLIPVLSLIGMGVAGYLAYVETTHVEAVCGPVGDCNTVQQSEYARLFGILPIGILGIAGYVMILLAWFAGRSTNKRLAAYGPPALLAMTAIGLLFSIYLTFLEPFVIGATCAWCLTSAIIMTALLWLSLAPASRVFPYVQRWPPSIPKLGRYNEK